jgi:type VI secretion system secreted protein VgrG
MAIFSLSLSKVLKHEGGFVDDPDDRGGATNLGITQATLAEWRGKEVTAADVKALTTTEAAGIYKARYWDRMSLDLILSQSLAEAVMDFGVNAGIRTAGKALQQSLNWVRGAEVLVKDGAIGPKTLREVNLAPERELMLKFFEVRVRYYVAISRHRPQNRKFLYAWMRRALDHV